MRYLCTRIQNSSMPYITPLIILLLVAFVVAAATTHFLWKQRNRALQEVAELSRRLKEMSNKDEVDKERTVATADSDLARHRAENVQKQDAAEEMDMRR